MKKTSYFITDISNKTIFFRKSSGGTDHTLSIATLEKMYNNENIGTIQGLSSYYEPLLQLLLEKGKSSIIEKVEKKNYVIIIDEINRANISRVFGELITLIEEDKRSHGKIPMRVTLPSGDSFTVPSNLFIIGTMNTADKSISLLDIALRRRFEFVPMYPNILIQGVNSPTVLETINAEIIKRKGHDFTIGHAYFMGEEYTLEKTINNKVIPLLLEYFMNDEKEVAAILKAAEIEVIGWPMKMKTA
jgi:5-methylcytosine-specific restriction endonuclease McrBC GTP-binding regulatory subunit McrB